MGNARMTRECGGLTVVPGHSGSKARFMRAVVGVDGLQCGDDAVALVGVVVALGRADAREEGIEAHA